MAVLRKILQKQDLSSIETYVNDTTFNSKYFNVLSIEDTIPGGKSSFQILGSKYLTADVEIRVELVDKNGNPVYTEAIKYLGDKPSRHISIEVYENTPAGIGTLTILGSAEFLADGSSIPEEWRNLYNVKWERSVYIDPREKNTQPILFQGQAAGFKEFDRYQLPTLEISEKVRGVIVPSGSKGTPTGFVTQSTFTGGNYEANASGFGKPTDVKDASTQDVYGNPFPKPNSPIIPSITSYGQKPKNQAVDSPTEAFTNSDVIYESIHGIGNGLLTPPEILHPSDPLPPEEPNFTGQGTLIKKTTGDPFRAEFEGGIFKAVPSVNHNLVSNITGKTYTSSSFTASIIAVHSPDLLEIDRPFTIQNQKEYPEKNFKVPHKATSFTIDFEPAGQTHNSGSGESTIVYRSFAEVTIKNMKTFSGDVHRVKTFTKGFSEAGDFSLIADRLVEASDILNDRNTPTLRQKTGVFQNQSHLDKNWTLTRVVKGKNVTSISTSGSLSFTSTTTPAFMNGVIISGSNGMIDESIIFETKTSDLRVRPDVDYELKLRAILKVGEKDVLQSDGTTLQQAKGKVRFYLSGSKIEQDLKGIELGGAKTSFGDPVRFNVVKDEKFGSVVALQSDNSNNSVGKLIDFGIVRIPFKPNFENDVVVNDDTKLQVEVESGQLYLQRVELLPATETNFSPDEFTFVAPMPRLRTRPDIFDFKVEFYDRNANKAEYVSLREAVTFEGENEVIQGTDNLLTGSLYIGNSILSGIEAGGVNSAYIRSVGYGGFESSSVSGQGGFAIWSGSVSRSLNTSESYEGVGIELHDGNSGSFKFRTQNSDGVGEFDVRTDKFFLGKVGEQFVSGSDGNLEISSSGFHLQTDGKVTASQIFIDGGFIGGSLTIGESVTVDAATANQIRVPTGGPPFKAEILSDGYARFTTGSIASFTIDSNAISTTGSNSFYISGSATGIPTQDGAQNQFISASKFQVSALGDLTASNVLIEGGTITSDVDILGTVSANSILTPASANTNTAKALITATGYARFTTGSIASFTIDSNAISTTGSDSFYISGSATGIPTQDGAQNLFISSSKFQVSAKGDLTGSRVLLDGGVIGGYEIGPSIISSSNDALILKSSGQITGSLVSFTGGKIAGWTINGTTFQDADAKLRLNAGNAKITINSHTFGNAGIQLDYNSGTPRFYVGDGSSDYVKYVHGTGVDIKSAIFDLDATTLILDSATNSGTIRLGASGGPSSVSANTAGIYMDGTGDFQVYGDADNFLRFDISDKLEIKAETFDLATSTLVIDSGTNSGKIALGATPNSNISGTNKGVYLDGQGDFLLYGSATNYFKFDASSTSIDIKTDTFDLATSTMILDSGTNSGKIALGSTPNTSVAGTNQGIYMDGTGDFLIRGDASNFLKMDGTTFTIKSEIFALDTTNLDIDSASKRITINDGSADRIHIGEVDGGTTYGMKIFDGTGTADSDILVEFGEGQNYIAGWTIGTDTISSNNLVLHSSGKIETSNFASGLRGWRIDSLQNGIAEFENARIRGTLSTTVFEKETINAVGGQLYVANSTMITSSTHHPQGTVSASNATMSVVNVTGFTGSYEGGPGHSGTGKGEILAIKKVTDTGFSTEYVQVVSQSRLNPSSGTDLSGLLFVTRSYGGGISETGTGLSSSLGDPAFLKAQQYEPGQVVVSTGRHIGGTGATTTGSGFVRINANPNDLSTPFVDIVERTGSAIYDVDLKARLGDLSGLSSQYVKGADVKGFGLVTSNVFLTSSFFVGGINEHISFQTGSFEAKLKKLNLSTGQGLTIQGEGSGSANKIMLGLASAFATGDGVFMDGGGDFRVGGASSNYVKFDASTGVLTVDGTINITGGAINDSISGLQAGATASEASVGDLNDETGSLSGSIGTQINPYKTQVVLNSAGMNLVNESGAKTLATYGVTTELFVSGSSADKVTLHPDRGISIVNNNVTSSLFSATSVELRSGATTSNTASIDTNGLTIVKGGVTASHFGSTATLFGGSSADKVVVNSDGVEVTENSQVRAIFGSTSVIGSAGAAVTATSTDDCIRIADGTVSIFQDTNNKAVVNSDGLTITEGGIQVAELGSVIQLKSGAETSNTASIDSNGLTFVKGGVTASHFGSTATLFGGSSADKLVVNGDGIEITENSQVRAIFGATSVIGSSGAAVTATSTDDCIRIASGEVSIYQEDGNHSFFNSDGFTILNGNMTASFFGVNGTQFRAGVTTKNTASLDAQGLTIVKGGVTASVFGESVELRSGVIASKTTASLDANGLTIVQNASTASQFGDDISLFGGTISINDGTRDRLVIDANDITMTDEAGSQQFNVDSGVVTVGLPSAAHQTISSTTTQFIDGDGSTVRLNISNDGNIDLRDSGGNVKVAANTAGIKLLGDNTTTFTSINSDGVNIVDNNVTSSRFTKTAVQLYTLDSTATTASIDKQGFALIKNGMTASYFGDSAQLMSSNINSKTTASLDENGLIIIEGGVTQSKFAAEATIGVTTGSHVRLSGTDGVQIKKDANTVVGTFGPDIIVNNETSRNYESITSASLTVGRVSSASFSPVTIEGISSSNAIFDRVFSSNVNASNVQSTGSVSLFTSRSFTGTSSVPFVVHDEIKSTDALLEPSFQFSSKYTAKGGDAIGFPGVASGSGTGIFDISTHLTSDGQNATPYKTTTGQMFNLLGLRVLDDSGDNTSGGPGQFKGEIDSQKYTFINAIDKTRVPPAFRNLGGIRFQVQHDGSVVSLGNITAFGTSAGFTTLSDIKYKEDITQISESLDRVLELRPTSFVWKSTNKKDIGFIAQEVEEVIPEVVYTDKKGIMGAPDTKNFKTISYPKLIPLLVDSIQELNKKISKLESKLEKLEN